jgi:hypothetical protein
VLLVLVLVLLASLQERSPLFKTPHGLTLR